MWHKGKGGEEAHVFLKNPGSAPQAGKEQVGKKCSIFPKTSWGSPAGVENQNCLQGNQGVEVEGRSAKQQRLFWEQKGMHHI